jgi:PIN domain nuclease of toxin-antitoxin system
MIVLDTHIWVWWVHGSEQLTSPQTQIIQASETNAIGVSAISVWEVAKLVENRRLELPCSLRQWFDEALSYPGIRLIELTPAIAIESTRLPGDFHRDPADQIIVATARLYDCPLVTSDSRILKYPHVKGVE